jgi:hypothetical protein
MKNTIAGSKRLKRTVWFYNAIPAVFWSILNLTPICIYCYSDVNRPFMYWSLGLSLLIYLLPNGFFNFIQLSRSTKPYKNIGINVIKRYAQEGDLVNRFIKKRFPHYSVIKNGKSVKAYLSQTYHFERFHTQLLVFFFAIMVYAIVQKQYEWAFILLINNIIYNLYPNLLQQYTRIRLSAIRR